MRKQLKPDGSRKLEASGLEWIHKDALETILLEDLTDTEYDNFVLAMEHLLQHPYSYRKQFVNRYRKPLLAKIDADHLPQPQFDADGSSSSSPPDGSSGCHRDRSRTGKITIYGQDITYFKDVQLREQVLFSLVFTDMDWGQCGERRGRRTDGC